MSELSKKNLVGAVIVILLCLVIRFRGPINDGIDSKVEKDIDRIKQINILDDYNMGNGTSFSDE